MKPVIISMVVLAALFSVTTSYAQDETAAKTLHLKAQVGAGETKDLGTVEITSLTSSLKIMCEDEKGNNISTFILPATVIYPEPEED